MQHVVETEAVNQMKKKIEIIDHAITEMKFKRN